MDSAEILGRLQTMTAWETEPALSPDEMDLLVLDAARADSLGRAPSDADWTPTWDLNAAAAQGWLWKIGKLGTDGGSSMGRLRAGDIEEDGSQVRQGMEAMVKFYRSRVIQNLEIPGGLTRTTGAAIVN